MAHRRGTRQRRPDHAGWARRCVDDRADGEGQRSPGVPKQQTHARRGTEESRRPRELIYNRPMHAAAWCTVVLATLLAGCGKPVDVKQPLTIPDTSGGYFDAGIGEGRNKPLPSVTFKVNKSINDALRPPSLNRAFKRLAGPGGAEDDFDES